MSNDAHGTGPHSPPDLAHLTPAQLQELLERGAPAGPGNATACRQVRQGDRDLVPQGKWLALNVNMCRVMRDPRSLG